MGSESRIWEIRPFGSMRGGRRRSLALCLSIQALLPTLRNEGAGTTFKRRWPSLECPPNSEFQMEDPKQGSAFGFLRCLRFLLFYSAWIGLKAGLRTSEPARFGRVLA